MSTLAVASLLLGSSPHLSLADTAEEIKALQSEIQNKKAEVETINAKLEEYKKRINEYSKKAQTLEGDIALLENETAVTELDIAATQNEVDSAQLEIRLLDDKMKQADASLASLQAMLSDTLFALHKQDTQGGALELLLAAEDFNQVFQSAAVLSDLTQDMKKNLTATRQARATLESDRTEREGKMNDLLTLQDELARKQLSLEAKKSAKEVLLSQTEDSESQYRDLLSEVRAEQQAISSRISSLQSDIENKLADSDTDGGPTVITWPIRGTITTLFHDPTYPFRYLFEHSGLDIAVPQGTPIEAAAPGYVAWAKTGRMYGNYVMIIHANGMATLYAHMSRLDVTEDQYVTRGQIIGLSGGRAGAPGSGFSTGPHVHFEVRSQGIPVDPMKYLSN